MQDLLLISLQEWVELLVVLIGRGIESIWDSDKSGNDYGDGTSY